MARRPTEGPTDAELEILHILWQRGEATVREVHEDLSKIRVTGYTTALKLLQIMTEKNLVTRDESQKSHVYRAAVQRDEVQAKAVSSMLDRLFDGSRQAMLVQALRARKLSQSELSEIRKLLEGFERKRK